MMVATRGKKHRAIPDPLHDLESKNAPVKFESPIEIRDLQMNMSDTHRRVNRV